MSEIENPVSRGIVEKNRSFDDYLPILTHSQNDRMGSWGVNARLPEKPHKKWIRTILGHDKFRERVLQGLESIFKYEVFDSQTYVEIRWLPHGASIETDGVNGCMVYVDSQDYGYCCHNVDTYEQATILFIAMSVYLYHLYVAMEGLESGGFTFPNSTVLSENVMEATYNRIDLKQPADCPKTYEECRHKLTFECERCVRNPRATRRVRSDSEYNEFRDKFEKRRR